MKTLLLLLSSVVYFTVTFAEKLSLEECSALGFSKDNLLCSSCALLPGYDLDILKKHCDSCCVQGSSSVQSESGANKVKTYAKAVLEVCACKFPSHPQIKAFCQSDLPKKFPTLTIKYIGGQMPQIKLYEEDGTVAETLAINKWDTDTIVEFLETYLNNAGGQESNDITDSE